jgi:hypothetical protein
VIALALFMFGGDSPFAEASGGTGLDPNIVGIDVDPSGNTATSLGTIDRCIEVGGIESTFEIDVFLDDVPFASGSYHNLGEYGYRMLYENGKLRVNTTDHSFLMATQGGFGVTDMGDCSAFGSSCPDADGSLYTSVTGLGGEVGAEPPGSLGATDRYVMEVVGGEGTLTFLTLSDLIYSGYEPGVTPWVSEIDQVWDASFWPQYGIVAIAPATCPVLEPVGGIAELPDVSHSAGWSYVALAGLAAAALIALGAGGWYARRRRVR